MGSEPTQTSFCVWCFRDGKPGHENQTTGLLNALSDRVELDVHIVPVVTPFRNLWYCLRKRFVPADTLPDPDLILGAGHATHLSMLAARRARGGKAVVLMKPSLPISWFDLCVIPEHDRPRGAANVLVTAGVLNHIRYTNNHDDLTGLLLIGGPSSHFRWNNESVIGQVKTVLERSPDSHWWLTTSRRTPSNFIPELLAAVGNESSCLTVTLSADTDSSWLPEKLASAASVWVTEDSVSMVYEALGSGAVVGLLSVPSENQRDRIEQGIEGLLEKGHLVSFQGWEQGRELEPAGNLFNEAARCADWIQEKWMA